MGSTEIYGARAKNNEIVNESSSGGMFTLLAESIIGQGGAVACAVYDYEKHEVVYKLITDIDQLRLARGSKYIQAYMGKILYEIEEWIKSTLIDQKLIFFGTGCHADGFRMFAERKGFVDRVYIVDIICHGVASPKVWKDYMHHIENENNRITYVTFKDKRNGWKYPYAYVLANNNEIPIGIFVDIYNSGHVMRPICYRCRYTIIDRKTDITIGDFWGIDLSKPDFYSPLGNSLILIHNDRGRKLIDLVSDGIIKIACKESDCIQQSLIKPCNLPSNSFKFWNTYREDKVIEMLKTYSRPSICEKVKSLFRKMKMIIELKRKECYM